MVSSFSGEENEAQRDLSEFMKFTEIERRTDKFTRKTGLRMEGGPSLGSVPAAYCFSFSKLLAL